MPDLADLANQTPWFLAKPLPPADRRRLLDLPTRLRQRIIAQDDAIEATVRPILRHVTGIHDTKRPVASLLYVGPTGVGKTDLALALADALYGREEALFRLDMSEYSDKHMVSRLFGAPPAYLGYEDGGQLTNHLRTNPYSIVLLDEIEKAHSSIFDALLQLLDAGRLTDGQGHVVDCTKCIVILTSNAGARELLDHADDPAAMARTAQQALRAIFRPEFLNRLDAQILFQPLTPEALMRIVDRQVQQALARVQAQGTTIQITPAVREALARDGYDPINGVRPLKRIIVRAILDPVADGLLRGDYGPGDVLIVDHDGTDYSFRKQSGGPPRAPSSPPHAGSPPQQPHPAQPGLSLTTARARPGGTPTAASGAPDDAAAQQMHIAQQRAKKACIAALVQAARSYARLPKEDLTLHAELMRVWQACPAPAQAEADPDLAAIRAALLAEARRAWQPPHDLPVDKRPPEQELPEEVGGNA